MAALCAWIVCHLRPPHFTACICSYDRGTLLDAEEVQGIKEDIREEAERVSGGGDNGGKVLALELPTPQSNTEALAAIGFVFIAFAG